MNVQVSGARVYAKRVDRVVNLLVVCAGSAIGGGVRYLVAIGMQAARLTGFFPWATIAVNIVGSFCIMLIATIAAARAVPANLQLFLTTGIMGGLTTYSTFDLETTRFFQDGEPVAALANVGVTLVACFVAGLLGIAAARAIL